MSNSPKPIIGECYLLLSTMLNPFDKKYARITAIKSGWVQFRTGTSTDYMPGKPKSCTVEKFMECYGPL